MENEDKKNKKILIIIVALCLTLTIILLIINKSVANDDKILKAKDYVIEVETDFSDKKGNYPSININTDEVKKINSEIINSYYSIVYIDEGIFYYSYETYNEILSLFVKVIKPNGSEHGEISYYSYNINLENNKVLSNDELLEKLDIPEKNLNSKIDERIKKYYLFDELNTYMSYDKYKEEINYDKKTMKLFIKDNKLYAYNMFNMMTNLEAYNEDIHQITISDL